MANPSSFLDILQAEPYNFKLKGSGPMIFHLGCGFERCEHRVLCMNPIKLIAKMEASYEKMFGCKPTAKFHSPIAENDHLELDSTAFLDDTGTQQYQSMIGSLQWIVTIVGHLDRAKHIYGYISKFRHFKIWFQAEPPDFLLTKNATTDWSNTIYGEHSEDLPSDAPAPPLGTTVVLAHFYYDANPIYDILGGNKAIATTFGAEFVSARTCIEQIVVVSDIRQSFRYLSSTRVLHDDTSDSWGNNKKMIQTSTFPHTMLHHKRHRILSYHCARIIVLIFSPSIGGHSVVVVVVQYPLLKPIFNLCGNTAGGDPGNEEGTNAYANMNNNTNNNNNNNKNNAKPVGVVTTTTTASIVDGLLSRTMMGLSARDRNAIHEEIHGVRSIAPMESVGILDNALWALSFELDSRVIPDRDKVAYLIARDRFGRNSYVNTMEFRLRMLRACCLDAKRAARKLCVFLNQLLAIFGESALERQIKLHEDFTKHEMREFRKGRYQLLPFRDRSGRKILVIFPDEEWERMEPSVRHKFVIYLSTVAASGDVETQKSGLVVLVWFESNYKISFQGRQQQQQQQQQQQYASSSSRTADAVAHASSSPSPSPSQHASTTTTTSSTSSSSSTAATTTATRTTTAAAAAATAASTSTSTTRLTDYIGCVRVSAIHICTPATPAYRFRRSLVAIRAGTDEFVRIKFHEGEPIELRYQLQSFGIPTETIPITPAGHRRAPIIDDSSSDNNKDKNKHKNKDKNKNKNKNNSNSNDSNSNSNSNSNGDYNKY
eukprot:jgi/Psemu1/13605/gm1.13605_g